MQEDSDEQVVNVSTSEIVQEEPDEMNIRNLTSIVGFEEWSFIDCGDHLKLYHNDQGPYEIPKTY